MKYASELNSDIAKRFTDLFADVFPDDQGSHKPQITKVGDTFFDEKLIHKTARGELVRSKSEAIITNLLVDKEIPFKYEEPLYAPDGTMFLPDFTVVFRGEEYYWEHIGRTNDPRDAGYPAFENRLSSS